MHKPTTRQPSLPIPSFTPPGQSVFWQSFVAQTVSLLFEYFPLDRATCQPFEVHVKGVHLFNLACSLAA